MARVYAAAMNFQSLLLCGAALLGACSTSETQAPATTFITGTASYRERMMLPPDATLEVVLEDVSRADAPADEISRIEVQSAKAPPYSFTLPYNSSRIDASHRYHVRARIMAEGKQMFQSDAGYAVLGAGNVTHVDLLLKRASAATSEAGTPMRNLRGMYSYMADAGWFVDCRSGVRLAVAQEGDNAALERAYSQARGKPGAGAGDGVPILAIVEARVEDRMPMEGPGPRPTLIVEKFISVEPGQRCSGPGSTAQLENTYWKLMAIRDTAVETPEGAREIHLVLNSEQRRINGFGGCNGFSGSYWLENEKIRFNGIATTMMACAGSGMETERKLQEILTKVTGWMISGETLQLNNEQGAVLATFESRYMK